MLDNRRICSAGSRRSRTSGFIFTFGLVALMYVLFGACICAAQSTDQNWNELQYEQSDQVPDGLTGQAPDQRTGQTPSQWTDETPSRRIDQTPSLQTDETSSERTDQTPSLQTDQTSSERTDQTQSRQTMPTHNQSTDLTLEQQAISAEQLISILEQAPNILTSLKRRLARQTGEAPEMISDEAFYERIRQSMSLREMVTNQLVRLGYKADLLSINPRFMSPGDARSPRANTQQAPLPSPAQAPPYQSSDSPQTQQRLSPYRNTPSLSDLYSQFPVTKTKLRRFGSDAFGFGGGNTNQLPMDLPVGPEYVLGPGDNLTVNMWGTVSNRLTRPVDRQGQIQLPEAGTIMISGMTIAQAQTEIQKSLNTQYQNEHVEISLGKLRSVRVYVVGDVQRPGAYDVSSLSTPLSALYAAGGPTSRGSLRILRQYRGAQLVRQFDLYDFLLKGVRSGDDRLQSGDTILVPPAGPQVTVDGMVRRPAIYELNGDQALNQVLDLAGGVLVSANLRQIRVERIEAHQSRTMFSLELPDNQTGVDEKLAAFKVQDGDDVVISQILPYNAQAVYLEGHVFRPGKYPYHDGMTIGDLLHSYQDVMPEPSDHAELVRLRSPDFRPETMTFNLQDALTGNDTIKLQPFDLVRIYGRYELDSPMVTISGEVLRPGQYPMAQGMTASQLVSMAGGFRRSAYRDTADLSSYDIQNGQKVLLKQSDVAIDQALEGNKSADVALKPGDVLSIRRLSGWQDIGASVTINGEVEHAGSYGIRGGERLSSVLKRSGGFREDAYPPGAVLERTLVRELNERSRQEMIFRVENTPVTVRSGTMSTQSASDMQQSMELQRQRILTGLRTHPVNGRMVIHIDSEVSKWESTPADIELRAGDTITIPKRPSFVIVNGQVYNPVAITYAPRKDLGWYLRQSGGATRQADKKHIYVLRVDGSVVVPHDTGSVWTGGFSNLKLQPGDTIFVPEKIVGGSQAWQNIVGVAQLATAVTVPLAITGVL